MKKIDFRDEVTLRKIAPFLSVVLGLLFGFLLLLVTGYPAVEGFKNLFIGGAKGITDGDFRRICNTLAEMTPLIFTGISVAFAFKTGLFNIGAPGQFLMGGFVAVLIGNMFDLNPYIFPVLTITGAAIAGAVWGAIPGFLKAKFNIHEVVTSIMLNYTAMWLVQYLCTTFIPGNYATESHTIHENAALGTTWLANFSNNSSISIGIFLGIVALIIVYIILEKTTFGYELKAVGYNKEAAKYAGMKVNRNIVYSMMIAGALAGIGGATYYTGYTDHIKVGLLLNYGFDGIAVALLGLNSPLGVGLAAFFFGYMKNGGSYMASMTTIPSEIIDVVVATIIYFSAISTLVIGGMNTIIKVVSSMSNSIKGSSNLNKEKASKSDKKGGKN